MEEIKSALSNIIVFCDGACSGNPGPGGWGAVIVFPEGRVREIGSGDPETTNNRMELTAAIRTLEFVRDRSEEVFIHTDSKYVIQGMTGWIWGWMKKGWKTVDGKDVANRELWQALLSVARARGADGKVSWRYVKGHAGIAGNDRADAIAVDFSQKRRPSLFDGPLLKYTVPVHDIPEETEKPAASKSRKHEKVAAYSYLSLIGDIAYRHSTWKECESRVKGRSSAKFKKAVSAEDEKAILDAWGIDPKKLR